MYTLEALQILIFLIPGFIAAAFLDLLIPKKKSTELGRIVEALIFSMIIYTIYLFVFAQGHPVALNVKDGLTTYVFDLRAFLWLFALSIAIPIGISYFIVHDWHMWILRKIGATNRTAKNCVWFDTLSNRKGYIVIDFENGRRICGWPTYYSDNPKDGYIYLSDASWINEKNEYENIDAEGILITPEQKIESITFLKKVEK